MAKAERPFLIVNPKSYLYGQKSLELALAADKTAAETGLQIFFTCPYADIRLIRENTSHVVVCAQSLDPLTPGRGMGHVLPESLKEAGADAVFLNHAENPKTVAELSACVKRAKELDMITVVCADSTMEAAAVACLDPDIVLAEPTDLIGTGKTADDSYVTETVAALNKVNPNVLVMIASGVVTADDCYNVVSDAHLIPGSPAKGHLHITTPRGGNLMIQSLGDAYAFQVEPDIATIDPTVNSGRIDILIRRNPDLDEDLTGKYITLSFSVEAAGGRVIDANTEAVDQVYRFIL